VDSANCAYALKPGGLEKVGKVIGIIDAPCRNEVKVGPLVVGVDTAPFKAEGVVNGESTKYDEVAGRYKIPHDFKRAVNHRPVGVTPLGDNLKLF
jgi:hypothetical protein